jgi:carboxymethylenebutenolidase
MCDQDDFDAFDRLQAQRGLTRRRFGLLGLGAGLAAALPAFALEADTSWPGTDVEIRTPDGKADAYFVHPESGRHPGVVMWPDIFGLRPALKEMAGRLAGSGYAVLVVNPFYRARRTPDMPPRADQVDPAGRETLMKLKDSLTARTAEVDAKAFVDFLDGQSAVDPKRKIGTIGYCMGGPLMLRTAAARADRVGGGASFHGGGLVTGEPDSPHLLIPRMKGQFLIAIAENDDAKDPGAKDTLREAFARARLPAEIEVYAGARHGWCPTDSRVYHPELAEKAWSRLLDLFAKTLTA